MTTLRSNARGFTLWELMVVVALVVFLFAAAIENLLPLRGDAERAAVLTTVGTLRSAVGLEVSRRVLDGNGSSLASLDGANPMAFLAIPPASYAGTVDGGALEQTPRGAWVFVTDSGTLFYRVRYPEYFEGDFQSPPGIRFRVHVYRSDRGSITGVDLVQLDDAAWDTSGSEFMRWMNSF